MCTTPVGIPLVVPGAGTSSFPSRPYSQYKLLNLYDDWVSQWLSEWIFCAFSLEYGVQDGWYYRVDGKTKRETKREGGKERQRESEKKSSFWGGMTSLPYKPTLEGISILKYEMVTIKRDMKIKPERVHSHGNHSHLQYKLLHLTLHTRRHFSTLKY